METTEINAVWGRRIRRLRRERNLTVTAVAREAGISREFLHLIERGGSGTSDGVKIRLAKVIGVDPNELFDLRDAS